MSWLSNLFGGKPKSPDTSRQDAEAARQREIESARAAEQYRLMQELAQQQRADEERRYQEQLKLQQGQIEQQRQSQQDEIARQDRIRAEQESQRAAERAAEQAQAGQRAQQARDFATGRQAMMDDAVAAVNGAYSSFDENFFQGFERDFVNAFKPKIEREFKAQSDDTTYGFADAGTLRSSTFAAALGDLQRGKNEKEGEVAGAAKSQSQTYRNDIDAQRREALSSIFAAGGTASPVLPDGTFDVQSGLGGLGSQLGALSSTARNRAQQVRTPSFADAGIDVSLSKFAKRPGKSSTYGVA